MEFPDFNFAVASTTTRPPKTNVPQITMVSGVKGKFKLNEAGSQLLDVMPHDNLVFVSNRTEVEAAIKAEHPAILEWAEENGKDVKDFPVTWAIAKGWVERDMEGNVLKAKKPLTKVETKQLEEAGQVDEDGKVIAPEIDRLKGSRLSSKSTDIKTGMIVEGTDGNNWPILREGFDEDVHVVYNVSKEGKDISVMNGNTTEAVTIYPISFAGTEDKIVRGSATVAEEE